MGMCSQLSGPGKGDVTWYVRGLLSAYGIRLLAHITGDGQPMGCCCCSCCWSTNTCCQEENKQKQKQQYKSPSLRCCSPCLCRDRSQH
jgi:hypothetical protein